MAQSTKCGYVPPKGWGCWVFMHPFLLGFGWRLFLRVFINSVAHSASYGYKQSSLLAQTFKVLVVGNCPEDTDVVSNRAYKWHLTASAIANPWKCSKQHVPQGWCLLACQHFFKVKFFKPTHAITILWSKTYVLPSIMEGEHDFNFSM